MSTKASNNLRTSVRKGTLRISLQSSREALVVLRNYSIVNWCTFMQSTCCCDFDISCKERIVLFFPLVQQFSSRCSTSFFLLPWPASLAWLNSMSSSSVLDRSNVVPVASSMDAISDDLAGIAGLSKTHNKDANGVNSFRDDLAGNAGLGHNNTAASNGTPSV